jgi:uncharacterized membrane protein YsdA (DUF1294 family)/cold shock CspA family protein
MSGITDQRTPVVPGQGTGRKGRLAQWDDVKGFGWIEADGQRTFAHIKEFECGQRRPTAGDEVTFTPGTDERGRSRATMIRLVIQTARISFGSWMTLVGLLILPVAAGFRLPLPWWLVPAWLGSASIVAWMLYARDKRKAQQGQWREQEFRLQLAGFYGGWPGAFLAKRRYRHKTVKWSFQARFWSIALLYQLLALDVVLAHAPSRWVWGKIME